MQHIYLAIARAALLECAKRHRPLTLKRFLRKNKQYAQQSSNFETLQHGLYVTFYHNGAQLAQNGSIRGVMLDVFNEIVIHINAAFTFQAKALRGIKLSDICIRIDMIEDILPVQGLSSLAPTQMGLTVEGAFGRHSVVLPGEAETAQQQVDLALNRADMQQTDLIGAYLLKIKTLREDEYNQKENER